MFHFLNNDFLILGLIQMGHSKFPHEQALHLFFLFRRIEGQRIHKHSLYLYLQKSILLTKNEQEETQ